VWLACVGSISCAAAWAATPKLPFNIPAGEFSQAIIEFSKQSQIEILYASVSSVTGVTTHPVVGELEITDALKKMLEGTGFTFEFENARSVLLKQVVPAAAVTSAPTQTVRVDENLSGFATNRITGEQVAMDEVVVTGSLIHGLKDIVSPLVVLGEKEKKRAAYGTVQDVLRTLPSVFGGGPSEDFNSGSNFNRGFGINLRGLGAGATLVLVNGRRQPMSGIDADFVDVSMIPWSVVERIEVLPDGASALYGSDAIAGVVNVIMRDDLVGAESQMRVGKTPAGAEEKLFAQLFGNHWDTGKWLFAYQYSQRTSLAMSQRSYSANPDKRPFGGSDYRSFSSSPGNILDPFSLQPAFAIPSGQDGTSLNAGDLLSGVVNLQNQFSGRDLLPERKTHSAFVKASQEISEHVELFAEVRFSRRYSENEGSSYDQLLFVPATNPFFVDPFGGSPFVVVAYNFFNEFGPVHELGETDAYTGTLGIKVELTDRWQATLSGFKGRESMHWTGDNLVDFVALDAALADTDPKTAFNPFGSGFSTSTETLNSIKRIQQERALSDVTTLNLAADGALFDLPAGTSKLAAGIDFRQESLTRGLTYSKYAREATAAFAELSLPLVERLEFSLAARYESYNDFGHTFNPKIGLRWSPTESLRFRSSWGSSFRAPTLVDLYDKSQDVAVLIPLADPHSLSGQSLALLRLGTNDNLHEERASTWTVGIDFAPESVPGLTFSSTYYMINYKDRTWKPRPPVTLESLVTDDQWASLITRNPSHLEVNAICDSKVFVGLPSDCMASSPDIILDARVRNMSVTTVHGLDLDLKQSLRTRYGSFSFGLDGSYLFSFDQALTRNSSVIDIANTQGNPPALRFRGTADWYQHGYGKPGFGLSASLDYLNSTKDYEDPPVTHIDAWATFDLQLSFRTSDDRLRGVELTLNAVNVFNEAPPFVNSITGYDLANTEPYGRVINLGIQKDW
jgi:outer membrane receptor protein involved in Fe transport